MDLDARLVAERIGELIRREMDAAGVSRVRARPIHKAEVYASCPPTGGVQTRRPGRSRIAATVV